jgi:hypothetical protein
MMHGRTYFNAYTVEFVKSKIYSVLLQIGFHWCGELPDP